MGRGARSIHAEDHPVNGRACLAGLLDWLARGPDLPAGDVHLALVRLTGRDPLIPAWRTADEFSARVRRIWPDLDLAAAPVPEVRDVVAESPRRGARPRGWARCSPARAS